MLKKNGVNYEDINKMEYVYGTQSRTSNYRTGTKGNNRLYNSPEDIEITRYQKSSFLLFPELVQPCLCQLSVSGYRSCIPRGPNTADHSDCSCCFGDVIVT